MKGLKKMKNIVLYKSRYGNTFQYATWIAEALHWEIRELSEFKKEEINEYQNIIFGTGVYMGKMNQIKKVLKWFEDKPIIIFACAGNNNVREDIEVIKRNNFTEEQLVFHNFFICLEVLIFQKCRDYLKSC
jgi:flavodoxin